MRFFCIIVIFVEDDDSLRLIRLWGGCYVVVIAPICQLVIQRTVACTVRVDNIQFLGRVKVANTIRILGIM